jgi:hypothetical protein
LTSTSTLVPAFAFCGWARSNPPAAALINTAFVIMFHPFLLGPLTQLQIILKVLAEWNPSGSFIAGSKITYGKSLCDFCRDWRVDKLR